MKIMGESFTVNLNVGLKSNEHYSFQDLKKIKLLETPRCNCGSETLSTS